MNFHHCSYKGQFENNVPNGKGMICDKNGNIIYEGDFVDGKVEGNGKINFPDGSYYIGQIKKKFSKWKGDI